MTKLLAGSIVIPLPALLVGVLTAGMIIGAVIGVVAVSHGYDKAQEQARIDRAADPVFSLGSYCPPPPMQ